MLSAYFADKIPEYIEMVNNREMVVLPFMEIYADARKFLARYNVCGIMAHNAKFDYRALNNTLRYLSGSKRRFFFPYGIPIWDTMKMANDTICKQKSYIDFCKENGYMTNHATPQVRKTAEVLWRYMTGDVTFEEEHTGLADVTIEAQIFAECVRQHKKMEKLAELDEGDM
jgi:DNA polymerase III epsilon subunit-like protein